MVSICITVCFMARTEIKFHTGDKKNSKLISKCFWIKKQNLYVAYLNKAWLLACKLKWKMFYVQPYIYRPSKASLILFNNSQICVAHFSHSQTQSFFIPREIGANKKCIKFRQQIWNVNLFVKLKLFTGQQVSSSFCTGNGKNTKTKPWTHPVQQ